MSARNVNGWLCVDYDGHDVSFVEIGTGEPQVWKAAYLDWDGDARVAKIRVTDDIKPGFVWLRVNSVVVGHWRYYG